MKRDRMGGINLIASAVRRLLPLLATGYGLLAAIFFAACPALAQDTDGDLMPDTYENTYGCLMPNTVDAGVDYDSDAMTSLDEYNYSLSLDPCDADTDDDGINDGEEVSEGAHPLDPGITPGFFKRGEEVRISSTSLSSEMPFVAYGPGEYAVVWTEMGDGDTEVYFARVASDGTKIGSNLRVTASAGGSLLPVIAWSGSEYGVAWADNRDGNYEIYFTRVSAPGTEVGNDTRITFANNGSRNPALVWTGSEYALTWRDNRDGDREIYLVRLSAAGVKQGSDFRLTQSVGDSSDPALAWTGSEYGLLWEDLRDSNTELYFVRANTAATAKIGSDLRLTTTATEEQLGLSLLNWSSSEYGTAWMDTSGGDTTAYFARLAPDGNTVVPATAVSTLVDVLNDVVMAWTGSEFGMAWGDRITPTSRQIIFTRISPTGQKKGLNYQVRDLPTGSSSEIAIAWGDSTYGLTWLDSRDGNYEIYFAVLGKDQDGDGLFGPEEAAAGTNPADWDSDDDRMPDGWEVEYQGCAGTTPMESDPLEDGDTDGLTNRDEYEEGADPCDPDSEDDGVSDGDEVNVYFSDPLLINTDGDAWSDGQEVNIFHTDPSLPNADNDADGLPNEVETNTGIFVDSADTGTDPDDPDTDGDGMDDGQELFQGSHPVEDRLTPVAADTVEKIGPELRLTYNTQQSVDPSVVWTGSEYGIVYADNRSGDYFLFFRRISSDGLVIGSEYRINMTYTWNPKIVWTGSEFGVIAEFYYSADRIYFWRLSGEGTVIGGVVDVSGADAYESKNPDINWAGSEFGVIWEDNLPGIYQLYFARISSMGSKIGSNIRIAAVNKNTYNPSLAWTGSEYGLSWDQAYSNQEIYFVRLSSDGNTITPPLRVTADSFISEKPSLTWNGNNYGVAWFNYLNGQNNDEIYFTRISEAGIKIDTDIRITSFPPSRDPSLVWAGSEYGLTWYKFGKVYFARISANGNQIGPNFLISPNTSDQSQICWTGKEFGLVWRENSAYEIYFTRIRPILDFDGDGIHDYDESSFGTDLADWDSDNDLMPDGFEVYDGGSCGIDPLSGDSTLDSDSDGLSNLSEWDHATQPCLSDTDADGMPDGWEVTWQTYPLSADSSLDPDNDSYTNMQEYLYSLNPHHYDVTPNSFCSATLATSNPTVPVHFTSANPESDTMLWVSFDYHVPYESTGLHSAGPSGTIVYTFAYEPGVYRFYTVSTIGTLAEPAPTPDHPDVTVVYFLEAPTSYISYAPDYWTNDPFDLEFITDDSLSTTELFYRKDSGVWLESGLTPIVGDFGAFHFTPDGEGTYDFYTIAWDQAGNTEKQPTFPPYYDHRTVVDETAPLAFIVSDGLTGQDLDYIGSRTQLPAHWTSSDDPVSGIDRYEYAVGSCPGLADVRAWALNYVSTSVIASPLDLDEAQTYFVSVRAYNGAELYTESSSDGAEVDTLPPRIVSAAPDNGAHVGNSTPLVRVQFADDGAGIDRDSFGYDLDFAPVSPADFTLCFGATIYQGATVVAGGTCGDQMTLSHQLAGALSQGQHVITVSLDDRLEHHLSQTVVFYIDDQSVLKISPPVAELWPGETVWFNAEGGKGTYEWTSTGGASGWGLGNPHLYTAGASPGIYTVSVSDETGASKSAPVTIHGALEIAPPLANLAFGETQEFSIVVGDTSAAVPPYHWTATGGSLGSAVGDIVTYTAGPVAGAYFVTVSDSTVPAHSFSARINVTASMGRAIIVAGGGPRDSHWDKNEDMAKRAFTTLVHRGFTGDKIYLLSNDHQEFWDGDFDGDNDIRPSMPSESALQAAFDWAQPAVGPNVQLILYLIDHGGDGVYQLTADSAAVPDPDERMLTKSELKGMLDSIQAASGCRAVVIYEACHSGSFMNGIANPAYSRKLIMSSAPEELSFLAPEPVFSLYFWAALKNGFDLKESFNEAYQALFLSQWKGHQHAQADGNGDGISGVLGKEGLSGIFIGTDVGTLGSFPEIVSWPGDQILSSATGASGATVWAVGESVESVAEVYALVVPPGFTPPAPQAGLSVESAPLVDLVKVSFANSHDNFWEGRYEGFDLSGVYTLILYAKDTLGQLSLPVETRVIGPRPYVTDEYPDRGACCQAETARIQFHLKDADDGVDIATLTMLVNGATVLAAGVDVTGGCSVTGTPYDYLVEYDPPVSFPPLSGVTVEIFAADYYGNALVRRDGDTVAPGDVIHFTITNANDGDFDGMADDWEGYYSLSDAGSDPDVDGASNLIEFIEGTNPRGADSTPLSPDLWEVDDLVSWSKVVEVGGGPQAHNFHDAGDVDWIKFTGVAGVAYTVDVYDVGAACNPVLEVYDAGLSLIANSNSGSPGEPETAAVPVRPSTGVIYLKVRNLDPAKFGAGMDYKLSVLIPGNPFGTLYGRVTAAGSGTPLASATVEILADGYNAAVTTDGAGWYVKLGLPAGTYSARASAAGFYSNTVSGLGITNGLTREAGVTLSPVAASGYLTGRVVDIVTGLPVGQTGVYSTSPYWRSDTTDSQGGFDLYNLTVSPTPYTLHVEQGNDYEPLVVQVLISGPGTYVREFRIKPTAADTDRDGLTDAAEVSWGTSVVRIDSDGDGFSDGAEDRAGSDPLDALSYPTVTPELWRVQGKALQAGSALDGTTAATFSLFAFSSGGAPLWTETRSVAFDQGAYHELLGGLAPLSSRAFAPADLYLGLSLGGLELSPRSRFSSAPSSFNSSAWLAGNRGLLLQTGRGYLSVSASDTADAIVVFPHAFASLPTISLSPLDDTIGAQPFILERIISSSPTGFTARFRSLSSSPSSGNALFTWTAMGE